MTRQPFLIALLSLVCVSGTARDAQEEDLFAHDTIDVGIVVSDISAATQFYTEALGLVRQGAFDLPAQLCTDAGLTDGQPLSVRLFTTDPGQDDATHVKLMELPGVESKPSDNGTIHSQLGIRYLTLGVREMGASLKRLEAAGVRVLGKGPVQLGSRPDSDWLALVRDPDGNLIELVGPKH